MSRLRDKLLVGAGLFGVPAIANLVISLQARGEAGALAGEGGVFRWPQGDIHYTARGRGEPMLFVHGVGAGNSSFEWRRNFVPLAEHYRVYALDLPGFGRSQRRRVAYTGDMYVAAVQNFLRDVVGEPAHLVASSLGAAYAIRVARAGPALVRSLAVVCPTGIERLSARRPLTGQLAFGVFSIPAIGLSLYNAITSYGFIESYMRANLYFEPAFVTPPLVEQYHRSAHAHNAQYAIRSFISGMLNCDVAADLRALQLPLLIAWGRHARETPVEDAEAFLRLQPRARLDIYEQSRLLPHDEESEEFNRRLLHYLSAVSPDPLPAAV